MLMPAVSCVASAAEPDDVAEVYPDVMSRIVLSLLLSLGGLATSAAAPAGGDSAPPVETGRWREHDVSFTYSGFTSKYSCDGLADKMKGLLRTLGARPDFVVSTFGCPEPFGGPAEFPRVRLRFASLEPAVDATSVAESPAEPTAFGHVIGREAPKLPVPGAAAIGGTAAQATGDPIPGAWQSIRFDRRRPRSLDPGDCELLEQFRDRVLPLFATRAVVDGIRCIPYQLTGTSLGLVVEAFAPLPTADGKTPPAREP